MWLNSKVQLFDAAFGVSPQSLAEAIASPPVGEVWKLSAEAGGKLAPWLSPSTLIERRGSYSRALYLKDPKTGGYQQPVRGTLVAVSQTGGLIVATIEVGQLTLNEWPLTKDVETVLDGSPYGLIAVNACATWLLNAVFPETRLTALFIRKMANGVVLEGETNGVERGVVLANRQGVSKETMALAEAARYDIVSGSTVDARSAATAVGSAIEALIAGKLERMALEAVVDLINR